MRAVLALTAACALAAAAALAGAQAPIVNARVERRTATQPLAREVQAVVDRGSAAWIGYAVPLLRRADARPGVTEWCCGRCRLEPPTELVVLARVEAGAIVDIRSLAVDCDVDAAGMPLVWFDGVGPDDSVAWLSPLARAVAPEPLRDRLARAAMAALALHATPAASQPLMRIATTASAVPVRSRAIALLAQRPAAEVLPALAAAVDDVERQVRRQAVSALGRLGGGAGVPRLIDVARTHTDRDVRRQAMLALGESRDPRALEFLVSILD